MSETKQESVKLKHSILDPSQYLYHENRLALPYLRHWHKETLRIQTDRRLPIHGRGQSSL
jgi:hypothetical protein